MKQQIFKRIEMIGAVAVMLLSSFVYILTMEKSSSLWDCPEFITTFDRLEVGHPPGAPFYMLVYNFFSTILPVGSNHVAIAANTVSALMSGATVMLLFLSISHLVRRCFVRTEEEEAEGRLRSYVGYVALGAAFVGSLLYAFTDTFWYSAVEAEVYSFSSLFTALVFYLMLKWEAAADSSTADRWIVGIAYLMGLSIGVHLLNLLCLPAMGLIYYYKKSSNPTLKGSVLALFGSFALIAIIMFGIVQGAPAVAGVVELFTVNFLGLPFNSGLILYLLLLSVLLIWGYVESIRIESKRRVMQAIFLVVVVLLGIPFMGSSWIVSLLIIGLVGWWAFTRPSFTSKLMNLAMLCSAVFFIGVSTYGVILIRANSDIQLNQNNPSDVFTLKRYVAREQYGSTPHLYGKTFASLPERNSDGSTKFKESVQWQRASKMSETEKDRYEKLTIQEPVYRSDMNMFFPRVFNSTQAHFPQGYKMWSDFKGQTMNVNDGGQMKTVVVPTFGDNLTYFFRYQIGYMYWRYFMWNFSGRQNDLSGQGEATRGNWITGFTPLDSALLGIDMESMPEHMKQNKGYNRYFMLPFLLGLLGIFFLLVSKNASRSSKSMETLFIVFMLFFMTGLAIILYLNQPPYQVRERDYTFAASFYAFSIWIAFGVAYVSEIIDHYAFKGKGDKKAPIIATLFCMFVPALVFAQNYDDHNRHGRTLASDFGYNYLESCEPNGIIFCNGDNDTFPLWYAQEVEGVRRDLRVCNTSYLQADWYVDQMKKDMYDSKALPISWHPNQYAGEKLSVIYVVPLLQDTVPLGRALDYASSTDPKNKKLPNIDRQIDYIPTETLSLEYNPEDLIAKGAIYPSDTAFIPASQKMIFNMKGKQLLGKHESVILNIMANNNFERPVYYCTTVPDSEYVGMKPYFRQTGLAYRVLPFRAGDSIVTQVDTERMYENVMRKFRWGGADRKGVYMDENARRMFEGYRTEVFSVLANALVAKGDTVRAQEVLRKGLEVLPEDVIPHTRTSIPLVDALYQAGMNDEALALSKTMMSQSLAVLHWAMAQPINGQDGSSREIDEALLVSTTIARINKVYNEEFYKAVEAEVLKYLKYFGGNS
ncbi:MAG: DUF2723 domain-containing protein [Porphyromonas sp.]|nr:DUF2723 domain-containing protein [Porphyromonas sp.]